MKKQEILNRIDGDTHAEDNFYRFEIEGHGSFFQSIDNILKKFVDEDGYIKDGYYDYIEDAVNDLNQSLYNMEITMEVPNIDLVGDKLGAKKYRSAFTQVGYDKFKEDLYAIKSDLETLGYKINKFIVHPKAIVYKDEYQIVYTEADVTQVEKLNEADNEQPTYRYNNLEDFLPHAELEILNLPNIVTTHSFANIDGPAYITPNGTIINIESYLILSENDKYITHDDCVDTIFKDLDTNKILKNPLRGDVKKDGGEIEDLIAFLEVRVGFIVCNRGGMEIDDRFYIRFLVNATRPTSMQYTRAIQFLDSSDEKPVEISLSHGYYNPVMQGFVFTPNKDIPEDAIKRVKRWYTTGKLVEDVDVVGDTAEFDNIQTTDEPVELKDIDTDLSTLIYPDDFKANGKISTFINAIYPDMGSLNPYHEYYDAADKCKNLIIVDGTTIIENNAFIGLGMEELVIPNSVTTVGGEILMHCKHIKSIFIPNSVVIVTDGAFTLYNCNPDCIIFCEAPERPDGWSFRWNYNRIDTHRVIWGCSKEEYERIKNNPPAPEINPRNLTFDYVSNDGRLVIDNDNQNIRFDNGDDVQAVAGELRDNINEDANDEFDNIEVSDEPAELDIINLSTGTVVYPRYFEVDDKDYLPPYPLIGIDDDEFLNIKQKICKKIVVEDGTVEVPSGQFKHYTQVTDVVLPEGLVTIGAKAFLGCSKLKNITIPKSVQFIVWEAFRGCTSLESIKIPQACLVSEQIFSNCHNLKSVFISREVTATGYQWFLGVPNGTVTVYVEDSQFNVIGLDRTTFLRSISNAKIVYNTSEAEFDRIVSGHMNEDIDHREVYKSLVSSNTPELGPIFITKEGKFFNIGKDNAHSDIFINQEERDDKWDDNAEDLDDLERLYGLLRANSGGGLEDTPYLNLRGIPNQEQKRAIIDWLYFLIDNDQKSVYIFVWGRYKKYNLTKMIPEDIYDDVIRRRMNEDKQTPTVVIAYHGSQIDDIQLSDKPLYATDDKLLAMDFAKGYCFNYDLSDKDRPTLYKVQLTMNNPRYIHTELEYDELMDIANSNAVLELTKHGFDGIIYEGEKFTYYLVFNAKTQAKVIEKQEVKCNSKRLYSKEEEYTKNYIDNDDKLLYQE